jgi:ParB-like chromosome segregation protein Spo0J
MTETTNKYQVMPPLSDEEYQALKEDMAENGMLVPVVQDTDGNVIDGHHRVRAYQELVAEGRAAGGFPTVERSGLTAGEKRDLAWRLNMQRRHLNREQKRDAIERKLKESPEWADNRIATLLGVDGKTVRLARVMLEGRKEIPKLKKLVGIDGKEYPRELENKKDMGLKPTFAKGLAQAAISRERVEGPLQWAGVAADTEHTEPREPGLIEQLYEDRNNEFDTEGVYLRASKKINDLALLIRQIAPEEAAKREFAHHAEDIACDRVMGRRRLRRIDQAKDAEKIREWLGEYIQRLEDAEARVHHHTRPD